MAKSKSTKSLKAKATRTFVHEANVWDRLDDLSTRLYTIYNTALYLGDQASGAESSAFYLLGKSVEREHQEVGELLHLRTDMPGRAAS